MMSFRIDEKLIEKYKTIWSTIEGKKNIKLHALLVYDDSYIKTKIGTDGQKVYTNFRGLNPSDDGAECESFTVISIDSLLFMETYFICEFV